MKKINFRHPKYIFPAVLLLPILYLGYNICKVISSDDEDTAEGLNLELPDAQVNEMGDKYANSTNYYGEINEDLYTAIAEIDNEIESKDSLGSAYTDDELERIKADADERARQQQAAELQRRLDASRRNIYGNSGSTYNNDGNGYANGNNGSSEMNSYAETLAQMRKANEDRQKMIAKALGIEDDVDNNEGKESKKAKAPEPPKPEPPQLVIKSQDANADRFNTVGDGYGDDDAPLIRAMIDKTTKAHEGTRIRFKLLDDVTIKDVHLKKGTYLYGTVKGFGQQRVMASITSIMVGNKFIKVDLSVFDNDGMEGFYVPASAFRDFMKNAGSRVASQSMNISSGYGSEITGEALALQALQNVYNSASSAVAANMRKNSAKIKYNTIVYLINSSDAE